MTESNTDRQHQRALLTLLQKGIAAIGLGAALMVAPSFLEPSSTTASVAAVLRMSGWLAMGVGLVLLGIRFSVQCKAEKLAAIPRGDFSKGASRQRRHVIAAEASTLHQGFPIATGPATALEATMQSHQDRRLQK